MAHSEETSQIIEREPPVRRFYGWRMVWIGAFVLGIGGYASGLPVVLLDMLLGGPADRSGVFGFGTALNLLAHALAVLTLPIIGLAVDRWGSRRLILVGLVAFGIGALLYLARMTFVVYHVSLTLVALGPAIGVELPVAAAVNNWFRRRRAMAMSILSIPSVISVFVVEPFQAWANASPESAAVGIAVVVLILAWPLSRWIRHRPEDYDQHPDGRVPETPPVIESDQPEDVGVSEPDYAWREALRTRAFWLLLAGGIAWSIAFGGLILQPVMMRDLGFPIIHGGGTYLVTGVSLIVSLPLGGWLGDRFRIRRVMLGFALLTAVAAAVLAFSKTLTMLYLAAALYGIGAGPTTALGLAAIGGYFGRRNFGAIAGITLMIVYMDPGTLLAVFLSAVPAPGALGSFAVPFLAAALIGAAGSFAFLFVGEPKPMLGRGAGEIWDAHSSK